MRYRRLAPRLAAASLAPLWGCVPALPDPGLVIGPRLLAIRTAVTEPLLPEEEETARAQALPLEAVSIEPFVVGPAGPLELASLDALWLACELQPGAALLSCVQDAMPLSLAEVPACPTPGPSALAEGQIAAPPSPCLIDRVAAPSYRVPLSPNVLVGGDIELVLIAAPGDFSADDCAGRFLDGQHELPDACLIAVQRLTTGPVERLTLVAAQLGTPLPGVPVPEPGDVPEADRHLRIEQVSAGRIGEDGEPESLEGVDPGAELAFARGDSLRIELRQPAGDLQAYEIPVNDGDATEPRQEAHEGRWFRTWGTLLGSTSDDPESFNEWSLLQGVDDESDEPPDGRAFLYYVVRDGRQGVAWWWASVTLGE